MKKILLFLCFLGSPLWAEQVQVTSPLPLPVNVVSGAGGNVTINITTGSTSAFLNNYDVLYASNGVIESLPACGTIGQVLACEDTNVSSLTWITPTGGGGGGGSTLETIFGIARSSPTLTIKAPAPFTGSIVGSTNTLGVDYSSFTMYGPNLPTSAISAGSLGSGVIASSITLNAMYGTPTLTGTNFTAIPGTQVGSGVPAANIASGSLGNSVIASSLSVNSGSISAGTNITSITGTWPNQTINAASQTTSPATPVNSVQFDNAGSFGGSSLFTFYPSTGEVYVTYGMTAGSATVNNLTASQFVITDASKNLASSLNGSTLTNLTAANISAGSLGSSVIASSLSVTSGSLSPGTNITSITGTWPILTINAATQSGGGGGGSALAVSTGGVNGYTGFIISSPTALIIFDSTTFKAQLTGSATAYISAISTITAASLGALTSNQSITWTGSGDVTGSASGATSITPVLTAAATQSNIRTFTSSETITGGGGLAVTYGVKAATAQLTSLGTNTNICTDGSSNLTTSGCSNGTLTGNQTITVSGDESGSGTTSIALTAAAAQANIRTFTSSETITGGGLAIVQTASANALNISTSSTGVNLLSVSSTPAVAPTDFLLNVSSAAGTTIFGVTNGGNVISSGTIPTVSSCGTSPSMDNGATNFAGTINVGSASPTACTLTFANGGFVTTPTCIVSDDLQTAEPAITSRSATAITITLGAALNSGHLFYICVGGRGG